MRHHLHPCAGVSRSFPRSKLSTRRSTVIRDPLRFGAGLESGGSHVNNRKRRHDGWHRNAGHHAGHLRAPGYGHLHPRPEVPGGPRLVDAYPAGIRDALRACLRLSHLRTRPSSSGASIESRKWRAVGEIQSCRTRLRSSSLMACKLPYLAMGHLAGVVVDLRLSIVCVLWQCTLSPSSTPASFSKSLMRRSRCDLRLRKTPIRKKDSPCK